jgi:transmembrane sensor
MNDSIDFASVERYVAGQCTPAERARIEEWIRGEPGRHEYIESLRAIGVAWADELPGYDSTAAWAAVRERVTSGAPGVRPARVRAAPVPRRWPRGVGGVGAWHWLAVAAALVMVVVGLDAALGILRPGARSPAVAGREYATAVGQRLSLTLADRTQLTLAPASRMRLAADYGRPAGAREVELEGEAYFAVAHDAAHPFAVRAHGTVARDVGTAFDVRAYPEDAGTRIAVAEGSVAVTATAGCRTDGRMAMTGEPCWTEARAGDVATGASGRVAVQHGVDVTSLTAWTTGRLLFDSAPLQDVLPTLERWYGVTVRVEDAALLRRTVTITLTEETPSEAIAAICAAMGLEWKATARTYTLYSQGHE